MEKKYNELSHEMMTQGKWGSITSDDLSGAMYKYIPAIEAFKARYAEDPATAVIIFNLVIQLAEWSYFGIDERKENGGYGDRPSDEPADGLASELAKQFVGKVDSGLDVKPVLKDLKDEGEYLAQFGIEPWYPMTIEVLEKSLQGEHSVDPNTPGVETYPIGPESRDIWT